MILTCFAYTNSEELFFNLNHAPKWFEFIETSIEVDIKECKICTTYDTGSRHVTPSTKVVLEQPFYIEGLSFNTAFIDFDTTIFTVCENANIKILEYINFEDVEKFPLEPLGFGI